MFGGYRQLDGITFARVITPSGRPELMTFEECRSRYHETWDADVGRVLRNWPTPITTVRKRVVETNG